MELGRLDKDYFACKGLSCFNQIVKNKELEKQKQL